MYIWELDYNDQPLNYNQNTPMTTCRQLLGKCSIHSGFFIDVKSSVISVTFKYRLDHLLSSVTYLKHADDNPIHLNFLILKRIFFWIVSNLQYKDKESMLKGQIYCNLQHYPKMISPFHS